MATESDAMRLLADAVEARDFRAAALASLEVANNVGVRSVEGAIAYSSDAQVYATLALVDVIREALAPEVAEQPPVEPPAPMEPASLWEPVDVDTDWQEGDLARQMPFDDAPVHTVVSATKDSFGDTVLRVRTLLDPHDDTPNADIPVDAIHIDVSELPTWRRRPRTVAS